ncbi:hypothetical protein DICVIV_12324 [Dictyocaulus viviparus]|uniref:Uncharacterized protein n=1 Tax=Dictyocaulus viviparus TaxID=29172 RepID=A0A0D8XDI4_DICVI|nr:hypothetical protein DICVIV_12324 [Dictyocaulus viviparus]
MKLLKDLNISRFGGIAQLVASGVLIGSSSVGTNYDKHHKKSDHQTSFQVRFARNLKPEQISLDVLKGKSKLHFIEINEEVLTDVLELPPWLRIKRAFCTGVTVSVPWTKLKSAPVQIFIDEINVDVILTSEPPVKQTDRPISTLGDTSYGFADRVVEGMSLYINTVEINFDSDAFGGSFMLSRLSVESRTPGWQVAKDLRLTRISCPTLGRALIYKQISWQLLRIEASAKTEKNEKRLTINAPLRLITSCEGTVVNAQIHMLLEDILWVATLPQLRSAVTFYCYITSLIRKSENECSTDISIPPRHSETLVANGQNVSVSNTFKAFDLEQTSYHLNIKKVDLHLCDDAHTSINEVMQAMLCRCWPELISFNVVIRIYDFVVQCVSDLNSKRDNIQNMLTSDRHLKSLPSDQFIFHFEFVNFMHPSSNILRAPAPISFLQLGPFSILFDRRTVRWCLYVVHNISTAFKQSVDTEMEFPYHSDLRIDLLLPKIIISLPMPSIDDRRFPLRLLISFSTISLSNCIIGRNMPFEMLNDAITYMRQLDLLSGGHVFVVDLLQLLSQDIPCGASELFWLRTSPCWVDTDHGVNTKPFPVVSDVCFLGAVIIRPEQLNIYLESCTQICAVVDRFQFLQIKKLLTSLSDYCDILAADQKHFGSEQSNSFPVIAIVMAINKVTIYVIDFFFSFEIYSFTDTS